MDGFLAQTIALICYGNAFLLNQNLKDLTLSNSTLEYVKTIEFFDHQSFSTNDVNDWFLRLKRSGCKRLKLRYNPSNEASVSTDRETSGFVGGGGIWEIEAAYNDHFDYWRSTHTTNDAVKGNRIWLVTYHLVNTSKKSKFIDHAPKQIGVQLAESLKKIRAFSKKEKLDYWTKVFEGAISTLNSKMPSASYYNDFIIEKNHSLSAKQLLFAASRTWVFGGMGTWNDMMFDDPLEEKKYTELSNNLFKSVINAMIVAVNN